MRTTLLVLLLLLPAWSLAQPSSLTKIEQVTLLPTDWADGDSFRVRFPNGDEHTLRLYGADCIEWHVADDSDARRLRAQRRYFGISGHGNSPEKSIALAKSFGEAAGLEVRRQLAKPFTVHTAFTDARGDGRFSRIYAFVTTAEGEDLSTLLVSKGLARAFGVYRAGPDGAGRDEMQERMKDAELVAARKGLGVWTHTDWDALAAERGQQRAEEWEGKLATGNAPPSAPVDVNLAPRDELMRIPGVGEVTANAIIEARPFRSIDDLRRVRGIGAVTLERIRPYVGVLP
jgi:DNA uptake protein ComE-like DNA-binding protein